MKIAGMVLIFTTIAVGAIVGIIIMPEGRVVEYRPDVSSGNYGRGGLGIQIVIEDGLDNYIPCDALSLREVQAMCDSLNKRITK